jgi:hypothetical protein
MTPNLYAGVDLNIHLTYRGPLVTCSRSETRADEKARLRRHFSPQLERHWRMAPDLKDKSPDFLMEATIVRARFLEFIGGFPLNEYYKPFLEYQGGEAKYQFIPTIAHAQREQCDLEIRWLRNEETGAIYCNGDIDGRLKTLFDALRMPHSIEEARLADQPSGSCYCLLEDDAMIRHLTIMTGRLLEQMPNPTDIHMEITAKVVSEND